MYVLYMNLVLISIISKIKKIVGFIFVFPAFNRLQQILVLIAYNELLVITIKTSWPLKLVITDFYCNIFNKNKIGYESAFILGTILYKSILNI